MDTTQQQQQQQQQQCPNFTCNTADLCDLHIPSPRRLQVVQPNLFQSYGTKKSFHGKITTIRCFESNPLVRQVLSEGPPPPTTSTSTSSTCTSSSCSAGAVLVVDGGGSQRCALLGDQLASMVKDRGWSGVVINGYIRDSRVINEMDNVGIKALGTYPVKSSKDYHIGERDIPVCFGGVEFVPGHYLYSDEDGILVSEQDFSLGT
jgi:RraA famliy